jgi:hypothetical protein
MTRTRRVQGSGKAIAPTPTWQHHVRSDAAIKAPLLAPWRALTSDGDERAPGVPCPVCCWRRPTANHAWIHHRDRSPRRPETADHRPGRKWLAAGRPRWIQSKSHSGRHRPGRRGEAAGQTPPSRRACGTAADEPTRRWARLSRHRIIMVR